MEFPFRYALGAALGMGVAVGAQAVTCRPGVQPAKPDSICHICALTARLFAAAPTP